MQRSPENGVEAYSAIALGPFPAKVQYSPRINPDYDKSSKQFAREVLLLTPSLR